MKKTILSLTVILILTINGFSQSIDNIVNKYISDSLKTFPPPDTTKLISTNSTVSRYGDTLFMPLRTIYKFQIGVVFRNTATGDILQGDKLYVVVERTGSGLYVLRSDPPILSGGNITKTNWAVVEANGLVMIKITSPTNALCKWSLFKAVPYWTNQ